MRIAVIGGIGSGKSEVLKVARALGINTLSADAINAELLVDPDYISLIAEAFPCAVHDGRIDKKQLAEIVFSDEASLKKLNALAHPRILKRIADEKSDHLAVEMPLLFEIGAQDMFDEIVLVYTPLELRIKRLEGRGFTRSQAESRISAQADEQKLKEIATRVIDNSGSLERTCKNAEKLFCDLLNIR